MISKSLAFIFRNNFKELLCFEHPITKLIEVVRGTVEEGENPQDTIIRELFEEAGIDENSVSTISLMGTEVILVKGGYDGKGAKEEQLYYGYLVQLHDDTVPQWTHTVVSDGIDNGHEYTFIWRKYDSELQSNLNPNTRRFLELYVR
jgi:putative (di)nucleoside polyphosphate hydrolase